MCFAASFFAEFHIYIGFLNADLPGADGFDLRVLAQYLLLNPLQGCIQNRLYGCGDDLNIVCHGMILA